MGSFSLLLRNYVSTYNYISSLQFLGNEYIKRFYCNCTNAAVWLGTSAPLRLCWACSGVWWQGNTLLLSVFRWRRKSLISLFFFIVAQGDDGLHSAHWWTSYHSQAPRLSEPWTVCCTFHSLPGCTQGLMRCMLGDDEPCTLRIIAWVTSILAQRAIRYRLMISFAVTSINVPEIHQQQFEYQCKLSWMGQDFWFYCSNLSVEIYSRICGSKKTLKENHITSKAANPIVIETSTGRVALTRRHRMEGW